MELNEKPLRELVFLYYWDTLQGQWNQVQERWSTLYEHWYPLLTDAWPADMLVVEAEWFLAEVPLSTLRHLLAQHGVEWIWEFRGEEAPASFYLARDLFTPCYTGDEGYWTSEGYDWLIYASQASSLTFAGSWLVEAIKASWPTWEQHVWREPGYRRPAQAMTPRPRGAFPGYERLGYDARLLSRAERVRVWNTVRRQWQIPEHGLWYPLIVDPAPRFPLVCFQEEWFSFAITPHILADILKERGIRRVWGITEGTGFVWEIDRELVEPWWLESYWTSSELDWILYVSHEDSITVAGAWFVEAIKQAWPDWHQYPWGTEELPLGWIDVSYPARLPSTNGKPTVNFPSVQR